jgi:hypothetical protein
MSQSKTSKNAVMLKSILIAGSVFLFGGLIEHPSNGTTYFSSPAAVGSTITGKITGGPNAGSFSATSADPTCSMGLTGPKSFGNQYSVGGKADNEFSSLQLIVDDYEAAKKGTDKFYVKVAFGKRLVGKKYEINGSDNSMAGKKQGSGKLTIKESGSTKTASLSGKTADGIEINVTLVCNAVVTAQGK